MELSQPSLSVLSLSVSPPWLSAIPQCLASSRWPVNICDSSAGQHADLPGSDGRGSGGRRDERGCQARRGWVLQCRKASTGGHGSAFVMGWDRPDLCSWPRTGKNSLYALVNGIQVTFLLSACSCVCLSRRPQGGGDIPAAHEYPVDLGSRESWPAARQGPRSLEIQLLLRTRLSLTLAGMSVLHFVHGAREPCVSLRP